jgi:diguanylate cyclase (GGDEF)-like protein
MHSGGFGSAEVLACYQHVISVATAVVREDGQLLQCNAGFRRLLEMRGDAQTTDVVDFFVQPRFDLLVATVTPPGEAIYSGVINVGDERLACRSLIGTVHRAGPNLILVAEHDVEEMERLNAQVIQLNEQLAETQRELARNARRLQASEARLRELSFTDPLTGLANRRRLEEFLTGESHRAQRYSEPFSIIMADIDHFKRVNDRFGHDVGDEVLQHFAKLLRASMREPDLVARIGGEEFVVAMPATDLEAAIASAERLRAATAVMRPPSLPDGLTASFGVAQFQPADTFQALLKHADDALYAAKNGGRNRVEAHSPQAVELLPAST